LFEPAWETASPSIFTAVIVGCVFVAKDIAILPKPVLLTNVTPITSTNVVFRADVTEFVTNVSKPVTLTNYIAIGRTLVVFFGSVAKNCTVLTIPVFQTDFLANLIAVVC
jgi:carbonic anhydrase/acetyltransferase-like protein (isoleucine patch superfamily)